MSPRKHDTIDYLDVCIAIPKALEELFSEFLADFISNHLHIELTPKLRDGILNINSSDLVAFTGYIRPEKCNELDLYRFKQDARKAMEQQLLKTLSTHFQAHYKWCIAAITSKEFGRSLHD